MCHKLSDERGEDEIKPRAAIVTGASGDIGCALVRDFSEAGYYVIATDLKTPRNELCCDQFLNVDLRRTVLDYSYANEVFSEIREILKQRYLGVIINNAASQIVAKIEELTVGDWNNALQVNLLAPFFWTQAFLPELEKARGNVVNISSIHARLSKPKFTVYATTKAALSGLTRSMALELGDRIRVNTIEPAAVDTKMLREGFRDNPAGLDKLEGYHPTKSIGMPEEVSRVALMLTDNKLQFLNGASIPLDGGIGCRLHDPA